MPRKKSVLTGVALLSSLALVGCSQSANDDATPAGSATATSSATATHDHGEHAPSGSSSTASGHDSHAAHEHPDDGGPAPAGMVEVTNPKFPVGSKVILTEDHMPGMKGAEATVVAAYDTTTYGVTYDPTDGGATVEDHKWVVKEELSDPSSEPLEEGDTATLEAEHMSGMKGARATISRVTEQPVYIVDVESGPMKMKNHKWMVEDEMKSATN